MKCELCGTNNYDGDQFCRNCGNPLVKIEIATNANTATPEPDPVTNKEGANPNQPIEQNRTTTPSQMQAQVGAEPQNFNQGNPSTLQSNMSYPNTTMYQQQVYQQNIPNPYVVKLKQNIGKAKNFIVKHKKPFAIGASICGIILVAFILYNQFYDFTKISWDTTGDNKITHTGPTTLNLSVSAYDKKNNRISDISFQAEEGEIKSNEDKVEWVLPDEDGEYTITATAPSGKRIKKTVKVIVLNDSSNNSINLNGLLQEEEKDEDDNDADGLTNAEEKKLGTNKNLSDTDEDGLSDYYEVHVSKTDPLKRDTDGDGIRDGDELDLNLNPLEVDSKGDGIKDGDRLLNFTVEDKQAGVSLQIKGKGNIASTTVDVLKNPTFSEMQGVLGQVYNFHSNGTIENALVTIRYNLADIQTKGLTEENLTLYYFNEQTKELEPVPTTVDQTKKEITVTLNHFSKYVIGDNKVVVTKKTSQVLFVIDNSVSMYTNEQMAAQGYTSATGAVGNDSDFKRLKLTNNLINMFTGNYEFGVSEFAGSYTKIKDFTTNKSEIKKAVNSIESNWKTNLTGTNIITALNSGIHEFSTSEEKNKYLILLTDGKNNSDSLSSNKTSIINKAKQNNIKICVIGLGNDIDALDLNEIATKTGCSFYNAGDASALEEIYSLMGADINYNYVDTDEDNEADGMIMANSGFLVNRDGFSFENFVSNKSGAGHCYGMATFAMLYYQKQLPIKMGAYETYKFLVGKWTSNGYDLSNTYFATNENLYDFKIGNDALKLFLRSEPIPGDYRDRIENDTWMIKKEYYDLLESIGATFSIKDYPQEEKDFSKYQSALLTIDNDTFNSSVSKDEAQLVNAIWRLFILQAKDDRRMSFSASPDESFAELQKQLENGQPTVMSINGNHAINAIRLIQDSEDANKFKIEVYDNNYPGETRYIEVSRSKFNKIQLNWTAWTNEYNYKFLYDANNDGEEEDTSVGLLFPILNYKGKEA